MKLEKGRHLTREKADSIIDGAAEILKNIGIKVTDQEGLKELSAKEGIRVLKDRAYIDEGTYRKFLENQKKWEQKEDKHGTLLHAEASLYTYHYRAVDDGEIKEFTYKSLTDHGIFVEKASRKYPLNPVVPGYPTDVPPQLTSLARYKIGAETCSGFWPAAPDSLKAAEYMFEMTQVMGEEMKHLPVYMISPLTLGGDSFEIVKKFSKKLTSFYTFSMPNLGVTTPMNFSMGMAMALAEVAGGAILVELLTGLPGEIKPNLFPFDFKYFNVAFGTPEKFLYEQAASELVAYIKDTKPDYSSTNIHTWGKYPDGRTAMEKSMMITAGALAGARRFYCAGTLSLDELFDPLQLIQDMEAIGFAQKLVHGIIADELEESMLEEITEGLGGGFVSSDRSLDDFQLYLTSSFYAPKDSLQKWTGTGKKTAHDLLKEQYREIDRMSVEYALAKEKQAELNKLYQHAMQA